MITAKDIEAKTMTPEKRSLAHNDYIAFYIGRRISYYLTIPFLYTNIRPDTISKISFIPTILGFIACCMAKTKWGLLLACLLFFLQDMLDGIDGNVARYKEIYSKYGSVWDAMSGYLKGCLSFLGTGVAAAHFGEWIKVTVEPEIYIILGALTGMAVIFPRLIMHKTITTVGMSQSVEAVKEKGKFSLYKIIALNLGSSEGGVQVLRLIAVLCGALDVFTVFYFVFFMAIAVVSICMMLKDD